MWGVVVKGKIAIYPLHPDLNLTKVVVSSVFPTKLTDLNGSRVQTRKGKAGNQSFR